MNGDLTRGPVVKTMLLFAIPMILGNMLQQCYNVADTLIVGRYLGPNALAAVGSAFTLMTFLTSILLGLCMGSGAVFSIRFGERDMEALKEGMCASFLLIAVFTVFLNILVFLGLDWIIRFLQVPPEIQGMMREYLLVIFAGIAATFLYNYFATLLRSVGNSVVPLVFLAVSAVLNIVLDLWFVIGLARGVAGAAEATVISQYVSGIGIAAYTWISRPDLRICRRHLHVRLSCVRQIGGFSALTCIQQSVMNFGILLVQGLVNSFGASVIDIRIAPPSKSTPSPTCLCRTSATPSPPLSPRTMAPGSRSASARGCGGPSSPPSSSVWSSPQASGSWPAL